MKIKNKSGFTYAESLLALIFLAVVMAPLLLAFPTGAHEARLAKNITMANDLAEDLMDEIKTKRMDEYLVKPLTDVGSLGYDGAEGSILPARTSFDDVDDYHGYPDYDGVLPPNDTDVPPPVDMHGGSLPQYSDFKREVVVDYVSYDSVGKKWDPSATVTDYKRIRVYVSGPYNPTVTLCTIVAFY